MSSQYGDRWRKAIDTLRLARCCKFIFNTQTMLYWTVEREKTLPCNNTWASVEYVHDYLVCSHNSKWLQFRSNNSKRTVRIHRIRFHFFFRFVRLFPHANGGRCYWMLLSGKYAQTLCSCRTKSIAIWLTQTQCGDASHYTYNSCWDYFNTRPPQLPILPLLLILSCFIQWISVFVDLSMSYSSVLLVLMMLCRNFSV